MEKEIKEKPAKKVEPDLLDILGRKLSTGNYVAISHKNNLQICQISRLSAKMIRVQPLKNSTNVKAPPVSPLRGHYNHKGYLIHANQAILVDGPDALVYILMHGGG